MEGHFKYETSKEIYLIYNNSNSHQWPSNTALDSEYTSSLHILSSYNNNNSYFDFDYDSYFKGTDSLAGAAPTLVPDANQAQEAHTTSSRPDELLVNSHFNNYWALLALILVIGTAAGNILVCLAIAWERRLQNVTNYFLMSLAITDLMVAVLVMPLGILTLVKGYFPLGSEHCLTWICLDVLFCTASIMHLCTISVDRYLSLRYPMRFGRNKTRRRVTLKIVFVWLLSIAMSLPLSLMYSKNHASVLVNGTCQIPDPVYKLVGSIVCFYIPLGVMLLTYCLTVRLLAQQRQNLGGHNQTAAPGWASGWLGQTPALDKFNRTHSSSFPCHPPTGGTEGINVNICVNLSIVRGQHCQNYIYICTHTYKLEDTPQCLHRDERMWLLGDEVHDMFACVPVFVCL